jgi:hypothetical protein
MLLPLLTRCRQASVGLALLHPLPARISQEASPA